ncbi:MAG TPA: TetR/AcrR family transcriptional regulator [Solirubrobacteraceae bacterium]|nr:TetR/AcrR family transcriptional regulator [Solirubrobacteraceae bacterium]
MPKPVRENHRDALLSAARTLMRQSGRGEITARDLVAASNTNLGSISYHFGSKEALLDEAARLVFEEWAKTVARTLSAERDAPPAVRLARSLEMILDDFDAMRPYFLGFIQIVAGSGHSPESRKQLVAHYRKQRDTVTTMVTESLGAEIDREDARHIASLLMSVSDGLMLQSLIDPDSAPTSRQLTSALARARSSASV